MHVLVTEVIPTKLLPVGPREGEALKPLELVRLRYRAFDEDTDEMGEVILPKSSSIDTIETMIRHAVLGGPEVESCIEPGHRIEFEWVVFE